MTDAERAIDTERWESLIRHIDNCPRCKRAQLDADTGIVTVFCPVGNKLWDQYFRSSERARQPWNH